MKKRPANAIDLGSDHWAVWVGWDPDRDLNPQYDGIPSTDRWGFTILHPTPDGDRCHGFVTIDGDLQRRVDPDSAKWTLHSEDPLHIEPSVLCRACGDHGWIRDGKWVKA